jgi:hypothetical protein
MIADFLAEDEDLPKISGLVGVVLQKRKPIWYSEGKPAKETRYGRTEGSVAKIFATLPLLQPEQSIAWSPGERSCLAQSLFLQRGTAWKPRKRTLSV